MYLKYFKLFLSKMRTLYINVLKFPTLYMVD